MEDKEIALVARAVVFCVKVVVATALVVTTMSFLAGCKPEETVAATPFKGNCELVTTTLELKRGRVTFPAQGRFVEESHYAIEGDKYPVTVISGIEKHLDQSCKALLLDFGYDLAAGCPEVYRQKWQKQWTPSEGGLIGQGAIGNKKPTLHQEMFQGNMMFKNVKQLTPGEKWLLYNPETKKAVVLSMGFEVGPGSSKFLGGSSVESHYVIGATNDTTLVVGKLKDQTVAYGPVVCK